jgi:ribosomal protein S18 acetylase RimI-like enzyme
MILQTAPATALQRNAAIARLAGGSVDTQVELLGLIADGVISHDDIFVLFPLDEPKRILAAMLVERQGPSQATVLPPVAMDDTLADEIARQAIAHLQAGGFRVVQSVNRLPADAGTQALERAGLARITDLVLLERVMTAIDARLIVDGLTLERADDEALFVETVARTYDGTLDVPELNGTQSLHELDDSLRAASRHDTSHWYFAKQGTAICGVVQLLPQAERGELAYMGLLPQFRLQKLGKTLATLALRQAAELGLRLLHLHYDRRNRAAESIYLQLGFREVERRGVWLKIFPRSPHVS